MHTHAGTCMLVTRLYWWFSTAARHAPRELLHRMQTRQHRMCRRSLSCSALPTCAGSGDWVIGSQLAAVTSLLPPPPSHTQSRLQIASSTGIIVSPLAVVIKPGAEPNHKVVRMAFTRCRVLPWWILSPNMQTLHSYCMPLADLGLCPSELAPTLCSYT